MRKLILLFFCFCFQANINAQKKPLDHTVYDDWQSIGEKLISNDGKWIAYTINRQEGDNELVIQTSDARYKKVIPRGYNAKITEDSRYLICKIKPFFKSTREAKIKKKKPDDMPKDSLAIIELGKDSVWKQPRVKTYALPEKAYGWVAYHLDKKMEAGKKIANNGKQVDSLTRIIDSLKTVIETMPKKQSKNLDQELDVDDDPAITAKETGTDFVLRNLVTGEEKLFKNVLEYLFSKNGQKLLIGQSSNPEDSTSRSFVLCYDLRKGFADTLSRGCNTFTKFAIADDGMQMAWIAERNAKPKALQRIYKIWYYQEGMDSAIMLVERNTPGMKLGCTVSENGELSFSKTGKRLFFGTAPIQPIKDTTLADIDLVKLDIWHYNDDYLQTAQLSHLRRDQNQNFLAVYDFEENKMVQLGSREIPLVIKTNDGDGDQFVGVTDFGKRIESQWVGTTKKDIYVIDVNDGSAKLIKNDLRGILSPSYLSPTGKYIMWYDSKARNYFVWDGKSIKNISEKIKVPLYVEDYDSPTDPPPYGIMGWAEGDSIVYINDRFNIWRVHINGSENPSALFVNARNIKTSYRYLKTDPEEKCLHGDRLWLFRTFDERNKNSGILAINDDSAGEKRGFIAPRGSYYYSILKAKDKNCFIYTRENYMQSPDLFFASADLAGWYIHDIKANRLSAINPQQKDYNWGTAEIFKWKAYTGKEVEGVLYKPENFDPRKKYPLICYFYEKLSETLNIYMPPSPTPSRLNIPFFVSRGYIVFAPDIHYTTGHPGRDAYNHVVSGARALVKQGFIDSTRIGIQGQSWGGYQVAYLVTATNLFKAAWAGAPVANMTSAYGGIRWESGLNRQFQYERTQSRIGATLWEKPELYIENSPLFHLPNVKTPLVIMSNDADGAVPWYQGIELFTGMRRLGKKVWLLNYNGEAHNLVERKNRKDIQVREQQFFDWLLKDAKPARWLTDGIPAIDKGRDWGLDD